MAALKCICGWSCGTQQALDKHVAKFAAQGDLKHGPDAQSVKILEMKKKYQKLDKSGDRMLDFEEFSKLLKKGNGFITDRELEALFQSVDVNGDGCVDFDEFLAHVFATGEEDRPRNSVSWTEPVHEVQDDRFVATDGLTKKKLGDTQSSGFTRTDGVAQWRRKPPPKVAVEDSPDSRPESPDISVTPASPPPMSASVNSMVSAPVSTVKAPPATATPKEVSSTVRVWLVRHARSANKEKKAGTAGDKDPELSEAGFDQAEMVGAKIGERLRKVKAGEILVVSSPMKRCLLTIRPALLHLNIADGDCRCHGAFYEFACAGTAHPGTPKHVIEREFPEFTCTGFTKEGLWDYRGSDAKETVNDCPARAAQIAQWIWDTAAEMSERGSRGTKYIIVSIHQTMSDIVSQILIDGSTEEWVYGELKYKLANTGITEIVLENKEAKFGFTNDSSHLRSALGGASPHAYGSPTSRKIAELRGEFAKLDSSRDGMLSFDEMARLLQKGGTKFSGAELEALFAGADKTGDGNIDFEEFLQYIFGNR